MLAGKAMDADEAIALGALTAGVRFFAGYPIPPASEIMEFLARRLPRYGGYVIQAEGEIAALGMCLGASYGGVRSLTVTSGPGLSLMGELLGYASMAEIPVVVVDVQGAGQYTGMPTKGAQGDLHLAIYGTLGDAPRVVLAPQSVEDCFYQTVNAVNIAHWFHVPVLLLSSQALSQRTETADIPPPNQVVVYEEPFYVAGSDPCFLRYALGRPDGVSIRSLPGTPGGAYRASGLEHDGRGLPLFDPEGRRHMVERRLAKLRAIETAFQETESYLFPEATVGTTAWGATAFIVKELVDRLRKEGLRASCLCPRILWPMPDRTMRRFLASGIKVLFVCEANATGQLAHLLSARYTRELMQYGVEMIPITHDTGLPFTTEELYGEIIPYYSSGGRRPNSNIR
jgi:2-oxoglutarate ferredoxin oxidoreductase subunit alpha